MYFGVAQKQKFSGTYQLKAAEVDLGVVLARLYRNSEQVTWQLWMEINLIDVFFISC